MLNLPPIDTSDRRRAERRSALDVNICLVDLGQGRSAMLLDVSETGIGVQSIEGPGEGLYASFQFTLPDTQVVVSGEAEIAWADRAGRMGLRFTNLAEETRAEIRKWVTSEANPLFSDTPVTDEVADLDARDRVAQLEARIIVSGWAQIQALNFLVDQIAAMTQASGVAIAVEDGGGIVCKASSGIAPQVGVRIDPRSGLSWECVRTREIVQCVDTETDPRVDRIVCRQLNMRSAMIVPVMKKGRVAGLVEVFSSRAHAFNNQTVILLRRVGEAVASLDETAPNIAPEEPLIPKPAFAAPAPAPIAGPVAVPSPPATSTPISYSPPAANPPTLVPAAAVAAPAPIAVAPAAKPVPVVVAPAPKPAPVAVAPAPPPPRIEQATPQVVPVASAAAVAPPASPAVAVEPVPAAPSRPALVTEPTVASTPAPAKRETPPTVVPSAPPTPKPVEAAVETIAKPSVEPKQVAPPVVKPAPAAVVAEPAPKKVVEKIDARPFKVEEKSTRLVAPIESPAAKPAEPRAPARSGPLPAVAFSGAAAAARPARVVEVPPHPAPPKVELPKVEEAHEEEFPEVFSQVEPDGAVGNRKLGIAAAAVVLVGAMGYGAWYLARPRVVYEASAQPPSKVETSANTAAGSAAATPALTPVGATPASSPTTAAKPPATPGVPANTTPPAGQRPATSEPMVMVATSGEPHGRDLEAAAPPVTIAPPNTLGVASILASPVPAPSLSQQRVSQGVSGGKQITRIQPIYPQAARTMRLTGTVTVRVHVDKSGNVAQVQVVKGHPMLNAAALDAVRRWKYQPFLLNGQPIENDINVDVRFDLPQL